MSNKTLDLPAIRHLCAKLASLYKNIVCLVLKMLSICLLLKCVNNLAPEMICPLISKQSSKGITTRGATNQNSTVPKRKTKFTQSTSSVQGTLLWNSLKMQTELNICQRNLKKWFKLKKVCEH